MYFIKDTYKKRLDLYFDEMPAQEIRNFLRTEGWHWNKSKRCWFTYLSQENIETAIALGATPFKVPAKVHPQDASRHMTYLFSNLAVLNSLYSMPHTCEEIRALPVSTDELKDQNLSADNIFEYLKLTYCLYKSAKEHEGLLAIVSLQWKALVDFCKNYKLIHEQFDDNIDVIHIIDCADYTFDTFRLQIERFLTGTDPEVQFVKCAFGVDVIDFEWWKESWDPTMCQLGHLSAANSNFSCLNYNELLILRLQMHQDVICRRYQTIFAENFNTEYWEQIIIWNLENQAIPDFVDDGTLYIHKGKIICQTHHHDIIQATAILSNMVGANIKLNVNYCTQCKKFFMRYSVYQHYRSKYGVILGDLKILKRADFVECEDCLAEESPLHLCGYSVAEKVGLSSTERQQIIAYVIVRGIMKKEQVISLLSWLIDTNRTRERMDTAVRKWNEDLSFVLQYKMDEQHLHIIHVLKKYQPNQFKMDAPW